MTSNLARSLASESSRVFFSPETTVSLPSDSRSFFFVCSSADLCSFAVAWFRVQGAGFRVQSAGFRVQGSGFRVQGSGFKVQGCKDSQSFCSCNAER